ncbi:peptidylprolyl isomerase [Halioxenophilus aromaticivorans]|uniref:PpiC domain-containing protein n=1 Tax=Halioxenophilus aromaticivorans TaxID=1306992 RepID=A0AAV3U349_9ALTE
MQKYKSSSWLRFFADPLVHFGIFAAVLYVFIVPENNTAEEGAVIDIPVGLRADFDQQYKTQFGREPSDHDYEQFETKWVNEEMLYRKGLTMGIDTKDPVVRDRIIAKTKEIYERSAIVLPPSRSELKDFYRKSKRNYQSAGRYDYEQLSMGVGEKSTKAYAEDVLSELHAGAEYKSFGLKYNHFNKRSELAIRARLGDGFVQALGESTEGVWQLLFTARQWYLIRVNKKIEGTLPDFDDVESLVLVDYKKQAKTAALDNLLAQLHADYEVNRRAPQ